jgi:hypothetical protein
LKREGRMKLKESLKIPLSFKVEDPAKGGERGDLGGEFL